MNRRDFLASTVSALGFATLGARTAAARLGQDESVMYGPDPMAAAEYLSILEAIEHVPALYTFYSFMHPDSQAIVPRATIIGWYHNDFQPRGPRPAIATGVTYLDSWAWSVNGQTYSDVAEVSYTQSFADGSVTNDVVRLCLHNGQWNWFFGRDRAWVEEQNYRFSLKDQTPQIGVAPYGFDSITSLRSTFVDRLPQVLRDPITRRDNVLTIQEVYSVPQDMFATDIWLAWESDHPDDIVPLGYYGEGTLNGISDDAIALDAIATDFQNWPPLNFHGWNAQPDRGLAWIYLGIYQNDMVGFVDSLFLVQDDRYVHISVRDIDAFETISAAIGG